MHGNDIEDLTGINPLILARRDQIAACRCCLRPCACYRNPVDGDCMSDAIKFVNNHEKA